MHALVCVLSPQYALHSSLDAQLPSSGIGKVICGGVPDAEVSPVGTSCASATPAVKKTAEVMNMGRNFRRVLLVVRIVDLFKRI